VTNNSHCWSHAQPATGRWVYLPIVEWLPVIENQQQVGVTFASYCTCCCDVGWAIRWRNIWGRGDGVEIVPRGE
jgi:hypothetical protein